MAADGGVCDGGVMQSTEQVVGGIHFSGCTTPALFVGERSPISLCRSNMPALYVKQRCDPDHSSSFFFSPTLALSKSIPSDVAEPFGLSVLRDANYMWRGKTERRSARG